jgi:hypothetical protein
MPRRLRASGVDVQASIMPPQQTRAALAIQERGEGGPAPQQAFRMRAGNDSLPGVLHQVRLAPAGLQLGSGLSVRAPRAKNTLRYQSLRLYVRYLPPPPHRVPAGSDARHVAWCSRASTTARLLVSHIAPPAAREDVLRVRVLDPQVARQAELDAAGRVPGPRALLAPVDRHGGAPTRMPCR